jgi:hypothetical protein
MRKKLLNKIVIFYYFLQFLFVFYNTNTVYVKIEFKYINDDKSLF